MLYTFLFGYFQIHQNKRANNTAVYFIGTIVPIKCMPKISAVGLFCLDKFENNQMRTCTTFFWSSKLTEVYFNLPHTTTLYLYPPKIHPKSTLYLFSIHPVSSLYLPWRMHLYPPCIYPVSCIHPVSTLYPPYIHPVSIVYPLCIQPVSTLYPPCIYLVFTLYQPCM